MVPVARHVCLGLLLIVIIQVVYARAVHGILAAILVLVVAKPRPDFNGYEIDFDEAMMRSRQYAAFEKEKREETCNLYKKN